MLCSSMAASDSVSLHIMIADADVCFFGRSLTASSAVISAEIFVGSVSSPAVLLQVSEKDDHTCMTLRIHQI